METCIRLVLLTQAWTAEHLGGWLVEWAMMTAVVMGYPRADCSDSPALPSTGLAEEIGGWVGFGC